MVSELEARIAALSDEIRRYPTPIARCDEQLTALIDERSRLRDERSRLLELLHRRDGRGGCGPLNTWINDGGFDAA